MARPLRIEFPGAVYHVTARGNARNAIFLDDADRLNFLAVLEKAVERFGWRVHAYCLMDNHYHLLIETPEPTLSRGMRHLNGVYTQRLNRRYRRCGHVFQGRYKAVMVDKEGHLLELCRYTVLNPVRAGMAGQAGGWPWSSFRATAGEAAAPGWLTTDWVLAQFAVRRGVARRKYRAFVGEGAGAPSPWEGLGHPLFLGGEDFIEGLLERLGGAGGLDEVPRAQRRRTPQPLAVHQTGTADPHEAMARAYASGDYSLAAIARHFGVHYSTVSRVVRKAEEAGV